MSEWIVITDAKREEDWNYRPEGVGKYDIVDVELREGWRSDIDGFGGFDDKREADHWGWWWNATADNPHDIVAYRVVKKGKE